MTSEARSQAARIGAHWLHATHDSRELTANGRAVFLSRFDRLVDPNGVLSEAERERRAAHARKAYMLQLAKRSAEVRKAAKA